VIIIVFGLSAAGKTYIGKVLQEYFAFHHEDADQWLPKEMQEYVHQKKLFSLEMLDDYTKIIIDKIDKLKQNNSHLVISQALYRQKNREQIQQYFPLQKIIFLQAEANDGIIHQRIKERGDWVNQTYAKEMQSYFQPMPNAEIIANNENGPESLIKQLTYILGEKNAEKLSNRR